MRLTTLGLAVGLLLTPAMAHADDEQPLKLERVRLYETGVAYFERSGTTRGANLGHVGLPVPAGHLDDALKTLVVLSKDGKASVDGVEFSSSVSHHMGLALAGLPADQEGKVSYAHLLDSLKGASVDLRTDGGRFSGRLVDVEPPPAGGHQACRVEQRDGKETQICTRQNYRTLMLLSESSEIRRFKSSDVVSVKPTDPAWRARLGSALDALSQRGAQTSRTLRVLGKPGHPVTLGYIAETPVWRSTYRLVLAPSNKSDDALQGWALLHNDTDEDWKKVKVELVNGRPDSFLFPLAAPRYAHRNLVTPQRDLRTVPQLLDQTVDNMWAPEGGGGFGEGIGLGGVGTIGHGSGAGVGVGYGSGHGRVARDAAESSLLAVGNLADLANATGAEAGALFKYALERPIDLRAHGSALLPFIDENLRVTRISYVPKSGEPSRTGVHLKNSTRQTLPAGPISVFASGGFAGETALSRTKPGETRILQFGYDLDLELEESAKVTSEEPRVLQYNHTAKSLTEHFVKTTTVTYALTNRSSRARKVYLPLDYVGNAEVKGADELTYDEERRQPIAVFDAKAGVNTRRVLEVHEGLSRSHDVDGVGALDLLRRLARATHMTTVQRASLRKAVSQYEKMNATFKSIGQKKRRLGQLQSDLVRLRKNVRALHGLDGADDMNDKLVALEEKYDVLQKEVRSLQRVRSTLERKGDQALKELKTGSAPR
jgi:hypothetical protein